MKNKENKKQLSFDLTVKVMAKSKAVPVCEKNVLLKKDSSVISFQEARGKIEKREKAKISRSILSRNRYMV